MSAGANSQPDCSVCLGKAHRSPLVEIRAGKLSLQPEAIGADQEATNDLKPSDEGCTKYVRDGEAFLEADFVAGAGVRSLLCLKSANS